MIYFTTCIRFIFKFYEEDGQDKVHVTKGEKIIPGISTFVDKPEEVGAYLMPLLEHAVEHIPPEFLSTTRVFILGTAGL